MNWRMCFTFRMNKQKQTLARDGIKSTVKRLGSIFSANKNKKIIAVGANKETKYRKSFRKSFRKIQFASCHWIQTNFILIFCLGRWLVEEKYIWVIFCFQSVEFLQKKWYEIRWILKALSVCVKGEGKGFPVYRDWGFRPALHLKTH